MTHDLEMSCRWWTEAMASIRVSAALERRRKGREPARDDGFFLKRGLEMTGYIERFLVNTMRRVNGEEVEIDRSEGKGTKRYALFQEVMGRLRIEPNILEYCEKIKVYRRCLKDALKGICKKTIGETVSFFTVYSNACSGRLLYP